MMISSEETVLEFKLKVKELRQLMDVHGLEAVKRVEELGGNDGICERLQTHPISGTSGLPQDIRLRKKTFGSNVIPPKKSKSFLRLVWEALQDVTLIILLVCALITMFLTAAVPHMDISATEAQAGWFESIGIFVTVIIVVLVTAGTDYSKEKQFAGLHKKMEKEQKFSVVRGGMLLQVPNRDIVVGDVCHIKYGDMLPADGVILQCNDLKTDESTLTGESSLAKKGEKTDPLVYSGTTVMEGSGKIVVTAVGINSQSGIIMSLLGQTDSSEDESRSSVLQMKLATLAIQIGQAGLGMAVLTVLLLMVQFSLDVFLIYEETLNWDHALIFVDSLVIGITVLVVAVPEGLPLAVTLSLAYSVRRMMKDNNLVRHLNACETMGSATAICCDKTGTLTTNRMTVVSIYVCGKLLMRPPRYDDVPEVVVHKMVQGMCVNSAYTSCLVRTFKRADPLKHLGNKTECALLAFVASLGCNYDAVRDAFPEALFVKVYTFNSERKSMSTVVRLESGAFRVYTKGAAEIVLRRCSYLYEKEGLLQKLTRHMRGRVVKTVIEQMSKNGLRTLTVAYRDFVWAKGELNDTLITREPDWEEERSVVRNLTLLCIVGIEDPVRPEVPGAIRICQRAGITVRMVTGDNVQTAVSIAKKCGIVEEGKEALVLDGPEFNRRIRGADGEVKQELLDQVWPSLRVLARSSPTDKYTLVKGIINSGVGERREVVAVTGDGTNDAPALKKADVGFAMGMTGTDVAKQASDIILLDDNFSSMVKAVMWGRNVYDNISRFLQFQLTVNVVAVLVAFIGACTVQTSPLGAVEMLWVNLIMDTLGSLALATDLPTPELLKRKPQGRSASLITPRMRRNILAHAFYEISVLMLLLFWGHRFIGFKSVLLVHDQRRQFTTIFNAFVLMTLFNEISCRKIHGERNIFKGLHRNVIFIFIWVSCFVTQMLIVQFGGHMFSTVPLSVKEWGWCLLFGFGSIIWHQIVVTMPITRRPSLPYWQLQQFDYEAMRLAHEWLPSNTKRPITALWHIFRLRGITRLREQTQVPDYRRSSLNPTRRSIFGEAGEINLPGETKLRNV